MSTVPKPPVRRGYADLPEGQVHFRERAAGSPAIVFLHQTALSSRSYEALLGAIDLPHRLVAPDLPGFGGSFRPVGWPAMGDYASWVLATLDALGIDAAYVFGHHTGASVAVEMARLQPARVRGLLLCGPVCFTRAEAAQFRDEFSRPFAPAADGSHLLDNWRYTAVNNAGAPPVAVHDQVVDMLAAWRARPQAYVAVADHDFERAFASLDVPTLILTADGDYFEDHVGRCLALRPGLPVVRTAGGNLAPELDVRGTAAAVARFVRETEASIRA